MASSPGRATSDTYKKSMEANYVAGLRDIPIAELTNILSASSATEIADLAENSNDFYASVPGISQDIKFNTSMYDDEVEDYIDCLVLRELIDVSRKNGDHLSAEKVRILRSARAVIYYSIKEKG